MCPHTPGNQADKIVCARDAECCKINGEFQPPHVSVLTSRWLTQKFRAAIRRGKGYTLLEGLRACKCCRESGVMCIAYESNVIPSFLTKETLYRHCQTCHHRKCKCVFERYSVTSMSQR